MAIVSGTVSTSARLIATQRRLAEARGGFSTKTYATVDAIGNPLHLLLTPGQALEFEQAAA